MLRISRATNGEAVLTLSGRMHGENLADLRNLLLAESKERPIVLDLKDLTLVDQEAVNFLEASESAGIKLKNCPAYIREWITRQRSGNS